MIQSGELLRHSFGIKECEPSLDLKLGTPEMKALNELALLPQFPLW